MTKWHLENGLARLLGIGTWLACALLATGLVLLAAGSQRDTVLLQAGIAIIVALPVVRVILMAWHFAESRQWRFAAIATTVLLVIATDAVAGLHAG